MERQFLILSLFFLIGLSSCQSNSTVSKNFNHKCTSDNLSTECIKQSSNAINEPIPVAENVWE